MKYGNAFIAWLPLAVAITGVCGLVYATVHQNYRQSLNDPQIEIAEYLAGRLDGRINDDIAHTIRDGLADLGYSDARVSVLMLRPFVAFFDDTGKLIVGTGIYL